jgi:hypothetical protein
MLSTNLQWEKTDVYWILSNYQSVLLDMMAARAYMNSETLFFEYFREWLVNEKSIVSWKYMKSNKKCVFNVNFQHNHKQVPTAYFSMMFNIHKHTSHLIFVLVPECGEYKIFLFGCSFCFLYFLWIVGIILKYT